MSDEGETLARLSVALDPQAGDVGRGRDDRSMNLDGVQVNIYHALKRPA